MSDIPIYDAPQAPPRCIQTQCYSILSVPFYDTKQQQYLKILCVNAKPVGGALSALVKTVRPPPLSGLYSNNNNNKTSNNNNACIHAITHPHPHLHGSSLYMTPDDLPELFAFLATNGYRVDLGLTKLAAKHQPAGVGNNTNSLVCLVSYP